MRSLVPNHKNDIPEYIVIRLRHDLTPCFGALYAIWSRNVCGNLRVSNDSLLESDCQCAPLRQNGAQNLLSKAIHTTTGNLSLPTNIDFLHFLCRTLTILS